MKKLRKRNLTKILSLQAAALAMPPSDGRPIGKRRGSPLFWSVSAAALAALGLNIPTAQGTTFTNTQTAAGTVNWSTGTGWSAVPVSASTTTLSYTGTLVQSAAFISNDDIAGNFLLNRLSITNAGTTTAGTLTLTGNPLEFVTDSGTTPTLNLGTGTTGPTVAINNNLVLTNNLTITATTSATLNGNISSSGSLTKTLGGTITLTNTNASYTGIINIGTAGTTTSGGTITVSGANGSVNGSNSINVYGSGSQLNLDYIGVANGAVDRVGNTAVVTLSVGGELRMNGTTTAATSSSETVGNLTLDTGANTVTINNGGSGVSSDILTSSNFVRGSNSATLLVRGSNLGISGTANARIIFTSQAGLTQIGTSTSSSGVDTGTTTNLTIIPYLIGATSGSGVGSAFVTYDTTTGLRRLGSAEMTLIASALTGDNVKTAAGLNSVSGPKVFNSVLLNSGGTAATPGTATSSVVGNGNSLTITSGALANVATSATGNVTVSGFSSIIFGTTGANEAIITNTNATAGGTLTIASAIDTFASGGNLTKSGGGLVVLSGTNLYTGATNVNQGTLQIGDGTNGTLNSASTINITPQGTFSLNAADGTIFANTFINNGVITNGPGASTNVNTISSNLTGTTTAASSVIINAGNVLALSGNNTYGVNGSITNGLTTLNGVGTLRAIANAGNTFLGNSTALSANSYLTDTNSGATLDLRSDASVTFATEGLTFTGSGARTFTINVDRATVSGGTGQVITLGGNVAVPNSLTTLTLNITGGNSYSLALGEVSVGSTLTNFTFNTVGTNLSIVSLHGNTITNNQSFNNQTSGGTYTFTGSGNTTVAGQAISSNSSRTQTLNIGSTPSDLTGSVILTGTTSGGNNLVYNLNSGTLVLNSTTAIGSGTVGHNLIINGGALDSTLNGGVVLTTAGFGLLTTINGDFAFGGTNPLTVNGFVGFGATGGTRTVTTNGTTNALTINSDIVAGTTTNALTKTGTGTMVLAATEYYTGGTIISGGTLFANGGAVAQQTVTGSNASTTSSVSVPTATLRVGQGVTNGPGNIPAGAYVASISSSSQLVLNVAIPTANAAGTSYTFAAGSALGTGAVQVTTGGTLAGTGNITGAVTVNTTAKLAPGFTAQGILGTGNLQMDNGSTLKAKLATTTVGTGYDQVNVTGGVTLNNATLSLSVVSYSFSVGDYFIVVNNDGVDAITLSGGTVGFNGLVDGQTSTFSNPFYTFRIDYDGQALAGAGGESGGNDVRIEITAIPEPTSLAVLGLGGFAALGRRRRRRMPV